MLIVGIDEVGRGCWAGPVVAAAVLLNEPIPGLADSKILTKKRREELDIEIREQALSIGLGWVDAPDIDKSGLTSAVRLAMQKALIQIEQPYSKIIIDGNVNFLVENNKAVAIIGADKTEAAVSAASIVAKVARDKYMYEIAAHYPQYGFENHVGYGTALHLDNLRQHGACKLHRLSYKPVRMIATGDL